MKLFQPQIFYESSVCPQVRNVFGKPSQTKIASEMEVALYAAYTVDTFDMVYTVDMVCNVYTLNTVYTVDTV